MFNDVTLQEVLWKGAYIIFTGGLALYLIILQRKEDDHERKR